MSSGNLGSLAREHLAVLIEELLARLLLVEVLERIGHGIEER